MMRDPDFEKWNSETHLTSEVLELLLFPWKCPRAMNLPNSLFGKILYSTFSGEELLVVIADDTSANRLGRHAKQKVNRECQCQQSSQPSYRNRKTP